MTFLISTYTQLDFFSFLEAYRLKMYGRKYQWIIVGMYRERWWEDRETNSSCAYHELTEAMEGHITTDVLPLSTSENITVSGLVSSSFLYHCFRISK